MPAQEQTSLLRYLGRTDVFFLLAVLCRRNDIWNHPKADWLIARCREIESEPNECLDLWSREHYKSTLITFGLTIRDLLASHGDEPLPHWNGREITVGLFSVTRPTAKAFLRQIKQELEGNDILRELYPDIIWQNPHKDAPKWSEDDGIILRRKSNPKESSVEAWGLVDSQPTSKHFFVMVYDDIVTQSSVTSPEMMKKTTEMLQLSYNCGTDGGPRRFVGTRYHHADTWGHIIKLGTAKPRIHLCTDNGEADGEPVLQTREFIQNKRRDMGPYIFGAQMLMNPVADRTMGFDDEWLRYYEPSKLEIKGRFYIVIDPASAKKAGSDYTAGWVIEACEDRKLRVREMLRDRLSLIERTDWLFKMHRKYNRHGVSAVGYEKYGMQADIEHIRDRQEREGYQFRITELGGSMPKNDRIRRLVPYFEDERLLLPKSYVITDYEKRRVDLVRAFIDEEYRAFPVSQHDDMLDALARILDDDMRLTFPLATDDDEMDFSDITEQGFVYG